ncbi:unnamed protein product [Cylicostephanus goldi]|uniref:Uncharacterized protein n=1 Tax=Cylicostephanus goldi TaxID=71465 RepID=A0A3P6SAA8_CYLGO|nr:unnamed protein product [Cylicostephanus goldi]
MSNTADPSLAPEPSGAAAQMSREEYDLSLAEVNAVISTGVDFGLQPKNRMLNFSHQAKFSCIALSPSELNLSVVSALTPPLDYASDKE